MLIKARALALLVDDNNKAVGVQLIINNKLMNLTIPELVSRKDSLQLDNGQVKSDGYIQLKSGTLQKKHIHKEEAN